MRQQLRPDRPAFVPKSTAIGQDQSQQSLKASNKIKQKLVSQSKLRYSGAEFVPENEKVDSPQSQADLDPIQYLPTSEPSEPEVNSPSFHYEKNTNSYTSEEDGKIGFRRILPLFRQTKSFFVPDNIYQLVTERNRFIENRLMPEDSLFHQLPLVIGQKQQYHSLFPLDEENVMSDPEMINLRISSQVYKVTSLQDGITYSLRTIPRTRITDATASQYISPWLNFEHPSIMPVRDVFISREFGQGPVLCIVGDFYPSAETLERKFIFQSQSEGGYLPESLLWNFIFQMLSALVIIHQKGLSVRILDTKHIVISTSNRFRLTCCGIKDIVKPRFRHSIAKLQYDDIYKLGMTALSLACMSDIQSDEIGKSIDFLYGHYSSQLRSFFSFVLNNPSDGVFPTAVEISANFNRQAISQLTDSLSYIDWIENELCKEIHNGILFRLLVKLGFIIGRPEYETDPMWADTGDRFLISLFQNYLFHQINEDSSPNLDFLHVINSLNKLDAGASEKIMLSNRDESSMLIVSFEEIKKCFEDAFSDLRRRQINISSIKK